MYALNEEMKIDFDALEAFLENMMVKESSFGFTFMVWQHFYKELIKRT